MEIAIISVLFAALMILAITQFRYMRKVQKIIRTAEQIVLHTRGGLK